MYLQTLARRDPWTPPVVAMFPPEIERTMWRDLLVARGDVGAIDASDSDLDDEIEIAEDVEAVQEYLASVIHAAMWSLRDGAWYVVHKQGRDRVVLGIRDSLATCRAWIRQHSDAYPADVAADMRTLARLLREVLETETADDLYAELGLVAESLDLSPP